MAFNKQWKLLSNIYVIGHKYKCCKIASISAFMAVTLSRHFAKVYEFY